MDRMWNRRSPHNGKAPPRHLWSSMKSSLSASCRNSEGGESRWRQRRVIGWRQRRRQHRTERDTDTFHLRTAYLHSHILSTAGKVRRSVIMSGPANHRHRGCGNCPIQLWCDTRHTPRTVPCPPLVAWKGLRPRHPGLSHFSHMPDHRLTHRLLAASISLLMLVIRRTGKLRSKLATRVARPPKQDHEWSGTSNTRLVRNSIAMRFQSSHHPLMY